MPRRRSTRRRRRRGSGLSALVRPLSVLLAAVAIVAALTMFFKVGEIQVSGNSRYTAEEIIAASGVEEGDNLILLDRYGASQRIYTDLPYIVAAKINPHFPDTLRIEVVETRAVASIEAGGASWLLGLRAGAEGSDLKVLGPAEEADLSGCMKIVGAEADAPAIGESLRLAEGSSITVERLTELITTLQDHDALSKTGTANFTDPGELALWYDGRFRVEMFYDANFSYKLDCLLAAAEQLEPNERGTIRMTMSDDSEVRFIPKR